MRRQGGLVRIGAASLSLMMPLLAGCRDVLQSLGKPGVATSRARAEELFHSLTVRVTHPYRDLKYDSARVRIAKHAVVPSRLWRDTSVWTATSDSMRQLLVRGHFDGTRYAMQAARVVAEPGEPGDARHVIELRRLSDDEYRWDTDVPFAVGKVTAPEIGAMFAAIMASAEGRTEADVREDYRQLMPRASRVAGQLFRVDSIRTMHPGDRSTSALFAISITPEGIEQRYPALAKYLRRYVHTARVRFSLVDSAGLSYFDMGLERGRLTVRVRTAGGRMLALSGPPRVMPDTLTLEADVRVRVSRFTIGVERYRGAFHFISTEHERAWEIVSREEPDWVLPLFTETLLRAPLRRPFQGEGAKFRIGVRDSAGAQSVLYRALRLEVQESAILRFIARLGAIAMSDYAGDVEREEMAWLHDLMTAMVADVRGGEAASPALQPPGNRNAAEP